MPRIFFPLTSTKESHISITGENARYLVSVLRCKRGDEIVVFDGRGNCFKSEIIKVDRREVIAEVKEKFPCDTESPVNIILMQGILKGQKMDMVVQKTTELGVKEIIPIISERSQLSYTRKVDRWRKIAEEAAKQSGRSIIPIIHEPVEINQFFIDKKSEGNREGIGLIFWEEVGLPLKEAIYKISSFKILQMPIYILIGPEGGFTKEEVYLAEGKGLIVTSLGKRILRAETAAISAIALVQFLLGDLG